MATVVVAFSASPWDLLIGLDNHPRPAHAAKNHSDLNGDGVVDLQDLILFSDSILGLDYQTVNWCDWIQDPDNNEKYGNKYRQLFDFINTYYQCDQPPPPPPQDNLEVVHTNEHPLRLALDPNGKLYVGNPQIGSVFIYDVFAGSLNLTGELKGVGEVLGVAVDSLGKIYVGRDDIDIIEVYDADGYQVGTMGAGKVKMPNDLALDRNDNLYVADSEAKKVWVYAPDGSLLRSIGKAGDGSGRFRFPCTLTIWYRPDGLGGEYAELYVGDQGQGLVQVFDLDGNFRRSFGGKPTSGMLGYRVNGKFPRLQGLQVDGFDRLHGLDSHMSQIQILNPDSGGYIAWYGTYGSGAGELALPQDMVIDPSGQVIVADYGNKRIEILSMP